MTLGKYGKLICQNYDLSPGQKICRNCTAKLFNQTEPEKKEAKIIEESMQVHDTDLESATDFVNQSPFKKEIEDVTTKFNKAVAVALNEPSLENDGEPECRNCSQLINMREEKLAVTTDREKIIQLLLIAPDSWLITKTVKFANIEYAVRQARELKKENGILFSTVKYSREGAVLR